jgi:hypothetical protein
MAISRELWTAVKTSPRRHYWLAAQIGMHSSRFSRLLSGELELPFWDDRVVRLARLVGVPPTRAFEDGPDLRLVPPGVGAARPPDPSIDGDDSTA